MHFDEASKKEILQLVKKSGNNSYEDYLALRPDLCTLQNLSSVRGNLTEWLHVRPGSGILEIGAGGGGLTSGLLKASAKVTAVEQDLLYADILSARFRNERDFKLLNMDIERALMVIRDAQMTFGLIVVNMDTEMLEKKSAEAILE